MLLDNELMFSKKQAPTGTGNTASSNVLDVGKTKDAGVNPGDLELFVKVDVTATSGGAATLTVSLQTDDNEAFGSPTTLWTGPAVAVANLTAGAYLARMALPRGCEQYLRLNYAIGTAALTAGQFTAGLVSAIPDFKAFPDNVVFG